MLTSSCRCVRASGVREGWSLSSMYTIPKVPPQMLNERDPHYMPPLLAFSVKT